VVKIEKFNFKLYIGNVIFRSYVNWTINTVMLRGYSIRQQRFARPIGEPLWPCAYRAPSWRLKDNGITTVRPWHFGVTWRHRSRDHWLAVGHFLWMWMVHCNHAPQMLDRRTHARTDAQVNSYSVQCYALHWTDYKKHIVSHEITSASLFPI